MRLNNVKKYEFKSGGDETDVSFSQIAIVAGVATIQGNNKNVFNSYLVANADFEIQFSGVKEGGTYVVDITKTTAADVLVTLPADSSPATINLIGALNSKFQLIITYDKFDDGTGSPVFNYVVTSFAL